MNLTLNKHPLPSLLCYRPIAPEAPRRATIPIRLISHPGQSLPKRDPLMPSNGCLMTLIKGVNVLMEPFEDRPNLYEDQFSQFIRKEPAADRERVCMCVCVCVRVWEGGIKTSKHNITPVTSQLRLCARVDIHNLF